MIALSDDGAMRAVRSLVDYARDHVVPGLRTDGDPYERAIVVALFARGVSLADANLCLSEAGHGREVMMLNRPLLELLVDAHWTRVDPDLAQTRFVQYARFTQHLHHEALGRYPELAGDLPASEELPTEEVKELEGLFGRSGQRGWAGLNLWHRMRAIEERFDEDERRQLWAYFELVHPLMNRELHPGSWSLGRGLRRVKADGEEERLQVRIGPEEELVPEGLKLTWWIFGHLVGLMRKETELPLGPFMEALDPGAKLFEAPPVRAAE